LPGDSVSVTENGIAVNDTLIPNSAIKPADQAGRVLSAVPRGDYQVADGDYWAIAPYPGSFDSRYFGPLPLSTVLGAAAPVLTWR
jgi:type IV secretory pathway protease TraF